MYLLCISMNENLPLLLYLPLYILYLHEKRTMGGAPYIGSRLGDGLIFEVSLLQLDVKEHPGKLPMRSSLFE